MKKNELLLILFSQLFFSPCNAQEQTSGLLERSQIEEKYKWDTRDVYENWQQWEEDFKWIEENLFWYEKYRGELDYSARSLLSCLQFDDSINYKSGYLGLYAKLHRDVEMNNMKYQEKWSSYSVLKTKIEAARSYIQAEIIMIPDSIIQEFIGDEDNLKPYNHYFKTLAIKKKHTLPEEQENMLAKVDKLVNNPYNVFGEFVYAELPFPVIEDDKGEKLQLNRSISWRARSSGDREFRKKGYQEYYRALSQFQGTLTRNLNSYLEGKVTLSDIRNYSSSLEASMARYNVPVEIYHNLITSVKANLQPFHRWMKMKKELLDLDSLYLYDTRFTSFAEIEREYSWEEAKDLTLVSLEPLGIDYLQYIIDAYEKRWIDAYPNVGKETGGYSSGPSGPHPYVKMNWGGNLLDVYTLVHELGHYVHASKTMEKQPFIYEDYPPFLGEIASTTPENICQTYLIDNSESSEEKCYHIEQYLDYVVLMIYNSAMMAEFELILYQKVENGEPLSADGLSEIYGKLLSQYYGPDVFIDDIDTYGYLEWPHYYLDYYLFSYASSFAASVQISMDILNSGVPAKESFISLLESGNSDFPVEILKNTGVDMASPKPYEVVAEKMNRLMDELEKQLK